MSSFTEREVMINELTEAATDVVDYYQGMLPEDGKLRVAVSRIMKDCKVIITVEDTRDDSRL